MGQYACLRGEWPACSHLARATATAVVAPVAIGSLKSLLDTFVAVEASEAISALAGHITTPASLAQFEGSEAAIDMLREAGAEEAAKLIARHLARNHPSTDERQSVRLLRRLRDLGMDDYARTPLIGWPRMPS